MTPEEHQQLIHLLDNQLSQPEQIREASGLSADPETSKQQKLLNLALHIIRYNGIHQAVRDVRHDLRAESGQNMAALYNQQQASAPPAIIRRFLSNAMKVAAVVFLAISVVGLGKFLTTSPTGVYDRFYAPYVLGVTRGASAANPLEEAYAAKDWAAVEQAYNAVSVKTGKDYFLTAMAYMQQKQYAQAIALLRTLIQENGRLREPKFQDEADYYLAMCYLANHEPGQAIPILEKIKSDPQHLFNKKVSALSDADMLILHAK